MNDYSVPRILFQATYFRYRALLFAIGFLSQFCSAQAEAPVIMICLTANTALIQAAKASGIAQDDKRWQNGLSLFAIASKNSNDISYP